jgi:hypothetical protein
MTEDHSRRKQSCLNACGNKNLSSDITLIIARYLSLHFIYNQGGEAGNPVKWSSALHVKYSLHIAWPEDGYC